MNSATFDAFKSRRELWIQSLEGDDPNSIKRQIRTMVWNTAAYRIINEARRIAPPAEEGGVQLNGMMHRLIDKGFFESQLLAIRRLAQGGSLAEDQERDVYSISSLLEDMKAHVQLVTRANLFQAEGLPYDVDYLQVASCQTRVETAPPAYYSQELDLRRLRERHAEVDSLTGVTPDRRSPDDTVSVRLLSCLNQKVLDAYADIRPYINKFLAHPATPESRGIVNADGIRITLDHLYQAHEGICKVANFIGRYLLTGGYTSFLAVPQYDQFAYIDRPLVTKEGIESLKRVWDEYDKETREWTQWGIEDLRKELEQDTRGLP